MHFGAPERGVFPLVSMLGDLCPVTVGAALAFKRRGEPRVALTFWGDGAMSTGDVHEGLNLAAVLKVPAVFVLQSNGYAYSTPTSRQMVNPCMADRVEGGWGIPATRVDGSDAIATLVAMRARDRAGARRRRPARGRGRDAAPRRPRRARRRQLHGSGAARATTPPSATRSSGWPRACALDGLSPAELEALRASAADEVATGLAEAEASPAPDPATLLDGVYATRLM